MVEAIDLANNRGVTATVINWGATLQSVRTPDRNGGVAEIQPGHTNLAAYLNDHQYRGVTVGRYANRIANARFALAGHEVRLNANEPPHALHGGEQGFDRKLWVIEAGATDEVAWAKLRLVSTDGDQGYPGNLEVTATWLLDDTNELHVIYEAETDASTIVNLTHHGYWNLAGDRTPTGAARQSFESPANRFLPIGADQIPLGTSEDVGGTPFDFRRRASLGDRLSQSEDLQLKLGGGFNHFFCVEANEVDEMRMVARLCDESSGRSLEIFSNQPGFQLYTGAADSVAIEAQMAPDTPNRPAFGSAQLDPGATYRNATMYRFSSDAQPKALSGGANA